ncbi:hypothetical protein [Sphingomonas sp. Leaf22]|uniref:hypothetical protein n=1 Tax=Sphingomonas sp. Leaf22 TaxID=1735687 RepID=UPI000AABAEB8|nr:hypothetical protein [Sphingomonas sp. Leaf22]
MIRLRIDFLYRYYSCIEKASSLFFNAASCGVSKTTHFVRIAIAKSQGDGKAPANSLTQLLLRCTDEANHERLFPMPEQFNIAAIRHLRTAEHLEAGGHTDDAGYHFGVCAENAVKCAMREAGLESYWASQGNQALRASPMFGHWSLLGTKIANAASIINVHAQGRRANPLKQLSASGATVFADWSIDIRYADPTHVPIDGAKLHRWKHGAAQFVNSFVLV